MHARPHKALNEQTHKRRELMEPNNTELAQRGETRAKQAYHPKLERSKPAAPQGPQGVEMSPAPSIEPEAPGVARRLWFDDGR